jgi:hypothetical protein
MACAAASAGDAPRALRLAGAAAAARAAAMAPLTPAESGYVTAYMSLAERALEGDEGAVERLLAEGRAMSVDRALEYAFSG